MTQKRRKPILGRTLKLLYFLLSATVFSTFFSCSTTRESTFFSSIEFSEYDTLRGTLNPLRSAYDVTFYHLDIAISPRDSSVSGSNLIRFNCLKEIKKIQVDLFKNLFIDSIIYNRTNLAFSRDSNHFFVTFPSTLPSGTEKKIKIYYHGRPVIATNPPWDGGLIFKKDRNGKTWAGVACEGLGASSWWPCKDHLADEPDSMRLTFHVPPGLTCVGNGTPLVKDTVNGLFEWYINYPVNSYNVTFNLGEYYHFREYFLSGTDSLPLDYYVLPYNRKKAREHFKQVGPMLEAFEHYFGPYPFPADGYALVETPYWGMEHQGAIAYGNNYINNQFGFDFIIIHESGHEWWGNSVSASDHGSMWIHEAFTTYAEALYIEYFKGRIPAIEYLLFQKPKILNKHPIQAPLGVNYTSWPGADMYYKGSWMLHTLRNVIDDDKLWFDILYKMAAEKYKIAVVTSENIISFMDSLTEYPLRPIFDQYLNYTDPPVLQYMIKFRDDETKIRYRFVADAQDFAMPVEFFAGKKKLRMDATKKWNTFIFKNPEKEMPKPASHLFYFIPELIP